MSYGRLFIARSVAEQEPTSMNAGPFYDGY
jgi:hypothetical protein